MEDHEIIRALEHCCDEEAECEYCPFNEKCEKEGERLITHALDLIKRQKEEIESRGRLLQSFSVAFEKYAGEYERLQSMYEAAIAGQETLQKCARKQIAEIFEKIEKIIVSNAINDLKRTYIEEVKNE